MIAASKDKDNLVLIFTAPKIPKDLYTLWLGLPSFLYAEVDELHGAKYYFKEGTGAGEITEEKFIELVNVSCTYIKRYNHLLLEFDLEK